MPEITRMTFFKLATPEDQDVALNAYKTMEGTNLKDGKPYILSQKAYKLYPDPRSGGFTFVAKSTFASLEDMKHYDDGDEAHVTLKKTIGPKLVGGKEGAMIVYMDS